MRSKSGQRYRLAGQFGALASLEDSTEAGLYEFQQRNGHLRQEILDVEIDTWAPI